MAASSRQLVDEVVGALTDLSKSVKLGARTPRGELATTVHIGTSGWNYADWRGRLYPAGLSPRRWLEHYAREFDTVEVNATFYRLASRHAVTGWVEQTPPDFVFAVKSSRFLTHMKRLTDMEVGVERFYERIEPLVEAGKLGPVLGSSPSDSIATTTASPRLSSVFRQVGTALSSATRAGSRSRSSSSCAPTRLRS